jgi:hypothetical protein
VEFAEAGAGVRESDSGSGIACDAEADAVVFDGQQELVI